MTGEDKEFIRVKEIGVGAMIAAGSTYTLIAGSIVPHFIEFRLDNGSPIHVPAWD